jgi:hypothetical protein
MSWINSAEEYITCFARKSVTQYYEQQRKNEAFYDHLAITGNLGDTNTNSSSCSSWRRIDGDDPTLQYASRLLRLPKYPSCVYLEISKPPATSLYKKLLKLRASMLRLSDAFTLAQPRKSCQSLFKRLRSRPVG